jgi:hypothetical protein
VRTEAAPSSSPCDCQTSIIMTSDTHSIYSLHTDCEDTEAESDTSESTLPSRLDEHVIKIKSVIPRTITPRAPSPMKEAESASMWLGAYFVLNLILTIYNKAVMQFLHFRYPWSLTAIHTLASTAGCLGLAWMGVFTPASLGLRENLVMIAFSTLYTVNIAISNVSLNLVTVPFHQGMQNI